MDCNSLPFFRKPARVEILGHSPANLGDKEALELSRNQVFTGSHSVILTNGYLACLVLECPPMLSF